MMTKVEITNPPPHSYLDSLEQPLHESLLSSLRAHTWSELCHVFYDSWGRYATSEIWNHSFIFLKRPWLMWCSHPQSEHCLLIILMQKVFAPFLMTWVTAQSLRTSPEPNSTGCASLGSNKAFAMVDNEPPHCCGVILVHTTLKNCFNSASLKGFGAWTVTSQHLIRF